jgi:pyruvate dehydrogenase E2 component (dihydrolipoamide acetyltransferase)
VSATTDQTLVTMPRLSDGMEDGTIVAWLIADGAEVTANADLVEIETDKATVTYQAPFAGVLKRLLGEGETVAVGTAIADLGGSPAGSTRLKASPLARRRAAEAGLDLATIAGSGPRGQIRRRDVEAHLTPARATADRVEVSPAARRAARQAGIDLAHVTGTGPRGRIRLADVSAHQETDRGASVAPAPTQAAEKHSDERIIPLSRSQLVVVRRMAQAKSTIPEFQVSAEIDMEACRELRSSLAALGNDRLVPSYNDMVIKACALALRRHPRVNSSYRDEAIELHDDINVGMAVAADERLLVATVKRADARGLQQIAAETRRLAGAVRDETITPAELSGATFTVSNLGMLGVDDFTAVINPPQAGILAVGAVAPRAVVRDGELAARTTMRATLTADHRVLYGADAARFLATVKQMLEQPLRLLTE